MYPKIKHEFLILLSFLIMVVSCENHSDSRYSEINNLIHSNSKIEDGFKDKDMLFIIPNAGCRGCITTAETFVIENIDRSESIKYIFTGTSSQKALKLKIGSEIYNSKKVFIDHEDFFYSPGLISIYPLVVYLKGGLVSRIEEVSPENSNALANLETELLTRPQNNN